MSATSDGPDHYGLLFNRGIDYIKERFTAYIEELPIERFRHIEV
jgi:hypothetical protein